MPGTQYWLVPDLGADRIYTYKLDSNNGKLILHAEIQTTAGSGPRHVAFHPGKSFVYIIEELSSSISVYKYNQTDGTLAIVKTISTLPKGFVGVSTCADIQITPSGQYLYGSNRGHDSISAFRILEIGSLESLGYVSTLGRTPRNFSLSQEGEFLLVANQDSHTIVVFSITEEGLLNTTGETCETFNIMKPVCLRVLPIKR